jgi:hypothetical protein
VVTAADAALAARKFVTAIGAFVARGRLAEAAERACPQRRGPLPGGIVTANLSKTSKAARVLTPPGAAKGPDPSETPRVRARRRRAVRFGKERGA